MTVVKKDEKVQYPWDQWLAKNVREINNPHYGVYYVQHVIECGAWVLHQTFGWIFLDNYQMAHFEIALPAEPGGVSGHPGVVFTETTELADPPPPGTAEYRVRFKDGKKVGKFKEVKPKKAKKKIGKKTGKKKVAKARNRGGSKKKA